MTFNIGNDLQLCGSSSSSGGDCSSGNNNNNNNNNNNKNSANAKVSFIYLFFTRYAHKNEEDQNKIYL